MSKNKRQLDIISGIAEDIIDSATEMRIKLLAGMNKKRVTVKRIVAFGSMAAVFLIVLVSAFSLMLFGKQVPVYTGMTVSSQNSSVKAIANDVSASLPMLLYNGDISALDIHGNPQGGEQERPLPQHTSGTAATTESTHDFAAEPKDEIYYAEQGEDFYITVHIDNPDDYEILSFTLNGVKYSSYMFEQGSDMENLILKCNAGDAQGIVEYTIDAIKYVDGTAIKDVILKGERTVKIGIYEELMPEITISGVDCGYNHISFDVSTSDYTDIFAYEAGKVYAVLFCGGTEMERKEISLEEKTSLIFENLTVNTAYTVSFVAVVDIADGNGVSEHEFYQYGFSTPNTVAPTVNITDIVTKPNAVGCSVVMTDTSGIGKLESIELWRGGTRVASSSSFKNCLFTGLENLETYTLKVNYSYDMHRGQGTVSKSIAINLSTQSEGLKISNGVITGIGTCKDSTLYVNMPVRASAFSGVNTITSVVIGPDCVLGEMAFSDCEKLENVVIRNGVTIISDGAFENCIKLKNISIPNSIVSIGRCAFIGTNLEKITIPSSVKTIGERAFSGCNSLISVVIPEGVTEIGENAFYCCASLESVSIPSSVEKWGDMAFIGCKELKNVTLAEGLKEIGKQAFDGCRRLESITIPQSVTKIGKWAFSGCERLTSVTLSDRLVEIGAYAFSECMILSEINLPSTLKTIGGRAFKNCVNLGHKIIIPQSVENIGENAFAGIGGMYVEATEKPSGWHKYWCEENAEIIWGYTAS